MACAVSWRGHEEPDIGCALIDRCDHQRQCLLDIARSPIQQLSQGDLLHGQDDEVAALTEIVAVRTRHKVAAVTGRTEDLVSTSTVVGMLFKWHPALKRRVGIEEGEPIRAEQPFICRAEQDRRPNALDIEGHRPDRLGAIDDQSRAYRAGGRSYRFHVD
jgi:hypothetical protein